MKFWLFHSVFMLSAVAYAAIMVPTETPYTHDSVGPGAGALALADVGPPSPAFDYVLGFGETPQVAEAETGEAGETAEPAVEAEVVADAVEASDGVAVEVAAEQPEETYLIYFTATWCGPCRAQKPVIEEIKAAGKYKVHIVDVDQDPQTARAWNVSSVPVVSTVVGGKVTYRGVGAGHSRAFLESKLESK